MSTNFSSALRAATLLSGLLYVVVLEAQISCPPAGRGESTFVGQAVAGGGYDVGEGEWNVAENWSPVGVPTAVESICGYSGIPRVVIPAGTRAVVAAKAPSSVESIVVAGTLEVLGSSSPWIGADLPARSDPPNLDNTIEVQAGGVLSTLSPVSALEGWTIDGTVINQGRLFTRGDFAGSGRIELHGDGQGDGVIRIASGETVLDDGLEIEVLSGSNARLEIADGTTGTLINRSEIVASGGDLAIGRGNGSMTFINEGEIEVRPGRTVNFTKTRASNVFIVENAPGALMGVTGDGASLEIGDTNRDDRQPISTRRPNSFTNNGLIAAGSGSTLIVSGDSWDNTSLGSISTIQAVIQVAGNYAASDAAGINRDNSSLELWGTADNASGTFVVDNASGQVSLARVTIDGTIDASGGSPSTDAFRAGPTLVDVTWIGPFRPSQTFRVAGDSLTLQEAAAGDSAWVLPGSMFILEPATAPQFTIMGTGTIRTSSAASGRVAFCGNGLSTSGIRYELFGGSISGPDGPCPSTTTDPTITVNGDIELFESSTLGFGETITTFTANGDITVPANAELFLSGEQVTTAGTTRIAGDVRMSRAVNFSTSTAGVAWSNKGDLIFEPGARMIVLRSGNAPNFPLSFTNEADGVWRLPEGAIVLAITNGPNSDPIVNRGRLFLGGIIEGTLQNFGMLLPGASPGTATIAGRSVNGPAFRPGVLLLEPSSTVMIDVEGVGPGIGYDQIVVEGDVELGGALTVEATIPLGDLPFRVIAVTDISGEVGAPAQTGVTGSFDTPPDRPLFVFSEAVFLNAPSLLEPGDSFSVTAGGWKPLTLVTAFLESTPVQVGQATADANGVVTIEIVVPMDFPPGDHTLVLEGLGPDDGLRRLSTPVGIPDPNVILRSDFELGEGAG